MTDEHGVCEISDGADRLSSHTVIAIVLGEDKKFLEGVLATLARQNPNGVETAIHLEFIFFHNPGESGDALATAAFDFGLGLDALVIALRIKPGDPTFDVPFFRSDRYRCARLCPCPSVANSIDPAAPPARPLPGPVAVPPR